MPRPSRPVPGGTTAPHRRALILGAVGLLLAGQPAFALDWRRQPLRLMAVTSRDCPQSAAWLAETAPDLARHPTGRLAPLLLVDIDGPYPDGLLLDARPRLTPCFILLRQGAELGRFKGYSGKDHFHAALKALLKDTDQTAHGVRSSQG